MSEQQPAKTIVGGRPEPGNRMVQGLPTGIQKLVLAAARDGRIAEAVVDDPVRAARELGLELSESESAILAAVPADQIRAMIEGLAGPSGILRRDFLQGSAAAVAVAATSTLSAQAAQYPSVQGISATRGIDAERPQQTRGIGIDRPDYPWESLSLEEALAEAKQDRRPLLALFVRKRLSLLERIAAPGELFAERICQMYSPELRREIADALLVTVLVDDPSAAEAYRVSLLPTILFLSDLGKELGRVEQPQTENAILEALRKAMEAYRRLPR
jgi:hypothetical protein